MSQTLLLIHGRLALNQRNANLSRGCSPDGSKKAYARLTPDVDALDIAANKLGLV